METILLLAQQRKPAQEPLSKVNPYLLAALLGGAVVVTAVLHFASPPRHLDMAGGVVVGTCHAEQASA